MAGLVRGRLTLCLKRRLLATSSFTKDRALLMPSLKRPLAWLMRVSLATDNFWDEFKDVAQFRWEAPDALTAGNHTIEFDFTYEGPGIAKGGTGVLKVDGKESPRGRFQDDPVLVAS